MAEHGSVSVPNVTWATSFEDPDGTLKDITASGGATVDLITNITYRVGATGIKTIGFAYDGSGDVLLRMGAGCNGNNDWWANHLIDDLMILGQTQDAPLQLWAAAVELGHCPRTPFKVVGQKDHLDILTVDFDECHDPAQFARVGGLTTAVLCPVHAVGYKLSRGRIKRMNRLAEAAEVSTAHLALRKAGLRRIF